MSVVRAKEWGGSHESRSCRYICGVQTQTMCCYKCNSHNDKVLVDTCLFDVAVVACNSHNDKVLVDTCLFDVVVVA